MNMNINININMLLIFLTFFFFFLLNFWVSVFFFRFLYTLVLRSILSIGFLTLFFFLSLIIPDPWPDSRINPDNLYRSINELNRLNMLRQQAALNAKRRFIDVDFGYVVHFPSNDNEEIARLRLELIPRFKDLIIYKISNKLNNFYFSKSNGPTSEVFLGTLILVGFININASKSEEIREAHEVYKFIKKSGFMVEAVKIGQFFITEALYIEFAYKGFDIFYLYKLVMHYIGDHLGGPYNQFTFPQLYFNFLESLRKKLPVEEGQFYGNDFFEEPGFSVEIQGVITEGPDNIQVTFDNLKNRVPDYELSEDEYEFFTEPDEDTKELESKESKDSEVIAEEMEKSDINNDKIGPKEGEEND